MALIQVAVTKRNGVAFSETYGLNTEKITDIFNENGETVFYYAENEDKRRKPIRYVTSLTKSALLLLFAQTLEAGGDSEFLRRRINLSAVARGMSDDTWNVNVNLDINRITHVWDSGDYAYVEFANGSFSIVRIKVEESLAQIIEEAGSGSAIATA